MNKKNKERFMIIFMLFAFSVTMGIAIMEMNFTMKIHFYEKRIVESLYGSAEILKMPPKHSEDYYEMRNNLRIKLRESELKENVVFDSFTDGTTKLLIAGKDFK